MGTENKLKMLIAENHGYIPPWYELPTWNSHGTGELHSELVLYLLLWCVIHNVQLVWVRIQKYAKEHLKVVLRLKIVKGPNLLCSAMFHL